MLENIVSPLLKWYDANKRVLPWRDRNNAYYTWVSEIMLQQTRVEAVKPYFTRFVTELPDAAALAQCPGERLMKLWEGLGYYSRVRNMQEAALQIMQKHGGTLPASYEALLELKGIGSYTAGAIASIAYGIPVPAVDGNVLRVISRLTESRQDIMKPAVRRSMEQALKEIIPTDRPGDFNQALMELGAVVCVPNGQAKCESCPLADDCLAYRHDTVGKIPVKAPKKVRTIEERTVFVIQDGRRTAIRKRPDTGLLAGLYELPNELNYFTWQEAIAYVENMDLEALQIEELPEHKHIFSHIEWRMRAYRIRVASLKDTDQTGLLFVDRSLSRKQFAIPSAFSAYVGYMKEER
jgi:A/G-specific adenine glycosylase